jgi:hypothetical protein
MRSILPLYPQSADAAHEFFTAMNALMERTNMLPACFKPGGTSASREGIFCWP